MNTLLILIGVASFLAWLARGAWRQHVSRANAQRHIQTRLKEYAER
jgi:hypothetical protein